MYGVYRIVTNLNRCAMQLTLHRLFQSCLLPLPGIFFCMLALHFFRKLFGGHLKRHVPQKENAGYADETLYFHIMLKLNIFLKKNFDGHMSLFWTSGDVSCGFQEIKYCISCMVNWPVMKTTRDLRLFYCTSVRYLAPT